MGQLKRQLLTWGAIVTTTAVLPGFALADSVSPDHKGGRHGRGDHSRGDRQGDAKLSVAGRAVSRGTTDSYGLQIRGRSGDQPTEAGGMIRFAHKGDNVMEGLVGEITCLSKDSAGIVSVTGTIKRSGKREGKGDKGDKNAPEMPGAPSAPKVPAPTAADDDGSALLDELAAWEAGEDSEVAEPARKGERDGKGERGRRGGGELSGKDFAFTIASAAEPQKFSKPTIGDKGTLAACSSGGESVEVTRGGFKVREAGADEAKGDENGKDNDNGKDRGDRKGRRGWWRR
ncbi:MAG TPA: hypothetical protein VJS45_14715 [Acidimicrobiia bacterium]|nr:hypothetical protein [Acidimicrobiia bacterium]